MEPSPLGRVALTIAVWLCAAAAASPTRSAAGRSRPDRRVEFEPVWGGVAGVVGGIGALTEVVGLSMVIIGAFGHPRRPSLAWTTRVGAPGADAGLSFELAF